MESNQRGRARGRDGGEAESEGEADAAWKCPNEVSVGEDSGDSQIETASTMQKRRVRLS